MNSSIRFDWNKPLLFSAGFATKLDELTSAFVNRLVAHAVTEAGHNAAKITSAREAIAAFDVTEPRDYSLKQLASSLREIETSGWEVTLKDESKIRLPTTEKLINLPNVGKHRVVAATLSNGSYSNKIDYTFRNQGLLLVGVVVEFAGPFELVQQFRSEIETLFAAHTESWWIFRDSRVTSILLALFITCLGASIIAAFTARWQLPLYLPPWSIIVAIFVLSWFIFPLFESCLRAWNWLFPMCCFAFQGGVKDAETRKNARRALWFVPIAMLAVPILDNLGTDAIRGAGR